ncbi:hypothetical protein AURDEDRAFT_160838 [Auricularia subglabra TFB-10046 SS5]|nr:hypothetical protein AURDEDRAFT_160838 [Auricularia subglabra TFB-10046 SS5]
MSLEMEMSGSRGLFAQPYPSVIDLSLRLNGAGPLVPIAEHFPGLQRLFISVRTFVPETLVVHLPASLLRLTVDDNPEPGTTRSQLLVPLLLLREIPVVEWSCLARDVRAVTAPQDSRVICGRAESFPGQNPAVAISFSTYGGAWRRSVHLRHWPAGASLPLAVLGGFVSGALQSLTLAHNMCSAFLTAPIMLEALRDLFIDLGRQRDVMWPRISGTYDTKSDVGCDFYNLPQHTIAARCPALKSVTIFSTPAARDTVGYLSTPLVRPDKFSRFGRALGLLQWPASERPTLVLVGCTFIGSLAFSGLDKSFSSIREVEFDTALLPPCYVECRWHGGDARPVGSLLF